MVAELVFAPEVEDDVSEAYAWYEARQPGLGEDFLSRLDACLNAIARAPELPQFVYKTYRRRLLRRFPYAVFYEYEKESGIAIVYSVFHSSQDPEKWRRRLPT